MGELSRRNFIGAGVAAAAFPALASMSGAGRPELRFGLVSDLHFSRRKGVADRRFREALEWFRSMGVDMDYLVSEETPVEVKAVPDVIAVRAFRLKGKTAVLAANRISKPVSGRVRFGDGKELEISLSPYGVKWIE